MTTTSRRCILSLIIAQPSHPVAEWRGGLSPHSPVCMVCAHFVFVSPFSDIDVSSLSHVLATLVMDFPLSGTGARILSDPGLPDSLHAISDSNDGSAFHSKSPISEPPRIYEHFSIFPSATLAMSPPTLPSPTRIPKQIDATAEASRPAFAGPSVSDSNLSDSFLVQPTDDSSEAPKQAATKTRAKAFVHPRLLPLAPSASLLTAANSL
ncbi:hypothetical protein NLI96_g7120 [Meripilus lineatus]|uniref:Uncharacterized protein n=1 Tax=Meripilus lineatus TaxID=2056292 RepID=A0AAD5V4Z2_9APHY|nr:hypothetical protein NLI96_g7120 [Physisporinus lineatus]